MKYLKAFYWWLLWKLFDVHCERTYPNFVVSQGEGTECCKLRRYHFGVHETAYRWFSMHATGLLHKGKE